MIKLLIILLFPIALSAQDTTYRRYITINGVTTSTSKGITVYVKGLQKTIDSLKNELQPKYDSTFIASLPFAQSWYQLSRNNPKKYYWLDSIPDFTNGKLRITIEYKVGNKMRTLKFIDDE
jgi:hypothetical protein